MSKEQGELITLMVNWFVKITVGIAAFLLTFFFIEMRNDIGKLGGDISAIKERLARIEATISK